MGMDVFGQSGNYFRANIWSWRALLYALELIDYTAPDDWHTNVGDGLSTQNECNDLASKLEQFIKAYDQDNIVMPYDGMAVDSHGNFVDPKTPGAQSPYQISLDHIKEFISFLRECNGFEIH